MSKLGYTFYPKDWSTSDSVFELTLSQRGLFRELIDLAMLSDNKAKYKPLIWVRKFNSTTEEIKEIIDILIEKDLIIIKDNLVFIPSCEERLKFVRNGKKGGKKSTKNKPSSKPLVKPLHKPLSNQKKRKEIESKYKGKDLERYLVKDLQLIEDLKNFLKISDEKVRKYLKEFCIELPDEEILTEDQKELHIKDKKTHFIRWIKLKEKNSNNDTSNLPYDSGNALAEKLRANRKNIN